MYFFTVTIVGSLAIISPGPNFLLVIQNSLQYGRKSGLQTAFGISLASLCHVLLNLFGIGLVITQSPSISVMLKNCGAAYLIYLGIRSISNSFSSIKQQTITNHYNSGFLNGFLCGICNPQVFLFYLSLFAVLLPMALAVGEKICYGLWLNLLTLLWFVIVAWFFTQEKLQNRFISYKCWLERGGGILLIGFGCNLIWL